MLAEWNAECGDDAPTVMVPWSDAETGLHWVNLRDEPYDIAEITEAEHFPALGRALRSLNATRSPLLTSKCDAWMLDAEDLDALRIELDLDETASTEGVQGYIDILWRERPLFASAHQQQDRLDRIVRRAQRLEHPQSKLELILRPALYHVEGALEGYAVTLYVTAAGADVDSALREWELALEDVIAMLRTREFEVARGSATID
ncbi:hypothetical protein ACFQBQ_18530 [Granulicella cerasi]|uniref:Uncharacterized protein n=1 Tax=Granulicella cerasi TaxID=741063 RepID=A0ABW1Z386_9BACT|nr:hypothetical protein [Granulicella cerasi]